MEAAGLVLAIFPVVVNGLTSMAEAVGTVKRLYRVQRELKSYARNIQRENVYYIDTLTELMDGIAESNDELNQLLEDPCGPLWSDAKFEVKLKERLDHSYSIYLETIHDVLWSLKGIESKFGPSVGASGQKRWSSGIEHEFRRFQLAFNRKAYEEVFAKIERGNNFLRETTRQNRVLEGPRRKWRAPKSTEPALKQLRRLTASLRSHITTAKCWSCTERHHHAVGLWLGRATAEEQTKRLSNLPSFLVLAITMDSNGMSPSALISSPLQWHYLEVESEDSATSGRQPQMPTSVQGPSRPGGIRFAPAAPPRAPPPPPLVRSRINVQIRDLCQILSTPPPQPPRRASFGYLFNANINAHKHHLFSHQKITAPAPFNRSVNHLLKNNGHNSTVPLFSRKQRLTVAAALAITVLYFDDSWLKPHWRTKDVMLLATQTSPSTKYTPDAEDDVLLTWQVSDSNNLIDATAAAKSAMMRALRVRNETLFALAITLIELSLGKRFEDLKQPEDHDANEVVSDLRCASRLLPFVYNESGGNYGDVVKRCLDCPFDLERTTLDDMKFYEAVREKTVVPLLDDVKNF